MGWLIDPEDRSVIAYPADERLHAFSELDQRLMIPAFVKDFQLTVGELFDWLTE
jgi:Uma2 family endonuclease